jgi:hypothetical protein
LTGEATFEDNCLSASSHNHTSGTTNSIATAEHAIIPSKQSTNGVAESSRSTQLTFSDIIIPGNCEAEYTIERTWTATDACGNIGTALQIITIEDPTPPTFGQPAGALDYTISSSELDSSGLGNCAPNLNLQDLLAEINSGLTGGLNDIRGLFGLPTATDDCSNIVLQATNVELLNLAGQAPCSAQLVVTYTATNECGRSSTYSSAIIILDDESPQIDPGFQTQWTFECEMPFDTTITGQPVFRDNCDFSQTVTVSFSESSVPDPNCPNGQTITREWAADDGCGNVTVATQVVTVVDVTAPEYVVFPGDTTVECSSLAGSNNMQTEVSAIANGLPFPVITDNCTTGLQATFTDVFTLTGPCPTVGVFERVFDSVDDGCGNILPSRTLTITVIDTLAPIFTSIPIGGDVDCEVGIPPLGTVTVSDCDPNVVITEVDDEEIVGVNGVVSIVTRTITATDACGNQSSQVETYRVLDQAGPFLLSCPDDIGPIVARPDDRATVNFPTPVFADNCSFSVSGTAASGQDFPVGITPVTYTAVDGGGNVTVCQFQIEVVKALNLTCTEFDISVEDQGDMTRADINFPYASTTCNACPQGEPLPSLDYLGYFRGHRYYVSAPGDTRSWSAAQAYAVSLGGRLVEVNSAEENRFLQRELPYAEALIGHSTGPRSTTWTGTFSSQIFENWAPGFPTTGTNEFFAVLNGSTGLHSNANHSEKPYIIEFPCVEFEVIDLPADSLFGHGPNCIIYAAVDQCGNRDTCHFNFAVTTFDVLYCTPFQSEFGGEEDYYITGVEVNAFAKTFGANDLFLNLRDTIELDEDSANSYSFIAETSGMEGANFPGYWRVWIDANRDGDFYDDGELLHESFGDAASSGTFDLPSTLGTVSPTRLRVGFSRYTYPEPCGDNPFGDVKDFSVKSNTVRAPRLTLTGARGMGQNILTASSLEGPEVDAYLMLRGASPDDLTKIDFWDALYGDGGVHDYVLTDDDPLLSAYYQAVALDDQGYMLWVSNVVYLEMPVRRDPVKVYPNPAQHHVTIDLGDPINGGDPGSPQPTRGDVTLYDAIGRAVVKQVIPAGSTLINMRLPDLATGTYMLRIEQADAKPETVRIHIDQSGASSVPRA